MVMKKVFLVGLVSLLFSGVVSGLLNDSSTNQVGVFAVPSADTPPVLTVDVVTVPSADVVYLPAPTPVPVPLPTPSGEPESFESSSIELSRGSGSSLTVSEMRLVMNGGRNYDTKTKTWGYRYPMSGERRNNFLLSWEAKRAKVGAVELLPSDLRYSK